MEALIDFVKRNPALIGIGIAAVALLAYWQSRQSAPAGGDDVSFVGGGSIPTPTDPGVVAMEQSRIEAGSRNIGTLASLLLGQDQAEAARQVELARTSATLESDLARTEAQRTVSLEDIYARERTSIADFGSRFSIAQLMSADSRFAAEINERLANQRINADIQADIGRRANEREAYATQRDVERVRAKSSFWQNLFDGISDVVDAIV